MTVTAAIFTLFLKIFAGVALLAFVLTLVPFFDWADRAVNARIQGRLAPPLFQPVLDILKLMGKENIIPRRAARFFFTTAPWLALTSTLMIFLYIPAGQFPAVLGTEGDMILVFYLLTLGTVAVAVGGFASGNPMAAIGANREITLMMSCGFPLAAAITTAAWIAYKTGMPGEPFSLGTFAAASIWKAVGKTGVFGLACLFLSIVLVVPGETGKSPMDLPQAETEILGGIAIEYSGVSLALLKVTFALRSFAMSAFVTSLFVPLSLTGMLGGGGFLTAAFDFFFFWLKVFVIQIAFVTLTRTAFGRLKIWQASRFYLVRVAGLSLTGMLLLSIDVMIR